MEIFIKCTQKTVASWAVIITESFRGEEELLGELAKMIRNANIGRKRVLGFMIGFLNSDQPDDVIDLAEKFCSRYDRSMARIVALNLHLFSDFSEEELRKAPSDLIILNELQIKRIFDAEIRQIGDHYKESGLFEKLKTKVEGGIESFGMWIYEAENAEKPLAVFNTEILMSKEGLDLSFSDCVGYYYFIASNVVEDSLSYENTLTDSW